MKTGRIFDKSFLKFLLVGCLNTLVSGILMFALEILGYWPSTTIAYLAGSLVSFVLNRYFTFKSDETLFRSAVKFALNVAVCYLLAYSVAQPVTEWLLENAPLTPLLRERITKLFGMIIFTCANYFGQRFFAFKKQK